MATSEDADDISSISWPGFVDIMSSVIMMFIFFVLITSVALYFHTITYKSKIMSQIAGLTQKSVQQQTQTIVKENQQLKIQVQNLQDQIAQVQDETKKADSKFAESKEQSVDLDTKANKVTLFFGGDSISLTQDTQKKYGDFIDGYMKTVSDPNKVYVEIQASKEKMAGNEQLAQEIATARLMNSRNIILKTSIPKDHITANIIAGDPINDKKDWVTIRVYQQ